MPEFNSERLEEIFESLPFDVRRELLKHIENGTSADWLSETLTQYGYPVAASTIKRQRRLWKESVR